MGLSKKAQYTCPYCFTKHNLNDVGFICKNDGLRCNNARNRVVLKPKIDKDKNVLPKKVYCDECGEKTNTYVCPNCKNQLPYTIGDSEDLIFSVIGAKEAGKSHYIAVLIDKISKEVGEGFNCSIQAVNDATMLRYRNDFYNPIFKKNEVIKVTHSAKADKSVSEPLIYTLSFKRKGIIAKLFKSKRIRKIVTIAFFDTAGEDLNEEDTMNTVNRYIYNSSGIIFLLDPLQLTKVREQLPEGTILPEQNAEIDDLLSRTTNIIRKSKSEKISNALDIPVAVAFSKIDALEGLLDSSCPINYPSKHTEIGKLDMRDFQDVNGTMESLIRSWGGENFCNQISSNFKKYAYFGLTALGSTPSENTIRNLSPHRVEDPFLWLLWKNKIIKAHKRK